MSLYYLSYMRRTIRFSRSKPKRKRKKKTKEEKRREEERRERERERRSGQAAGVDQTPSRSYAREREREEREKRRADTFRFFFVSFFAFFLISTDVSIIPLFFFEKPNKRLIIIKPTRPFVVKRKEGERRAEAPTQ